ncbi:hypothetical protein JB92DRAFT_3114878 [Gautieria morchelliformis]|nr:hypothetical protein JB92DRAFT_3114878 [Gautieria morchelliformis]
MSTGDDGGDVISSEDDEEIESDNAFEESDEDRFAGSSFAKKVPPMTINVRLAEVDLDEHALERQSGHDPDVNAEELDGNSDEFLELLDG